MRAESSTPSFSPANDNHWIFHFLSPAVHGSAARHAAHYVHLEHKAHWEAKSPQASGSMGRELGNTPEATRTGMESSTSIDA